MHHRLWFFPRFGTSRRWRCWQAGFLESCVLRILRSFSCPLSIYSFSSIPKLVFGIWLACALEATRARNDHFSQAFNSAPLPFAVAATVPSCDGVSIIWTEGRREFKDLKDAARERLAIAHAQEKEKIMARLRRSLGRGTGHSVSGLRGELWEEAHEKRNRLV